jgi:hypothetical protein
MPPPVPRRVEGWFVRQAWLSGHPNVDNSSMSVEQVF